MQSGMPSVFCGFGLLCNALVGKSSSGFDGNQIHTELKRHEVDYSTILDLQNYIVIFTGVVTGVYGCECVCRPIII